MENNQPTNEQKIKNELKKLDRYALYIGIFGIISMFVFTVLATQLHIWFDYTNTGQIGDTIGGLTAPIIGIFSALLIYLSFRAQIQANHIVQGQIDQQREDNTQMEIYKEIKESLQQFYYHMDINGNYGSIAIYNYLFGRANSLFDNHNNPTDLAFDRILKLFDILIFKLEVSKKGNRNYELITILLDHLFNQYIWNNVLNLSHRNTNKSDIYKFDQITEIELRIKSLLAKK